MYGVHAWFEGYLSGQWQCTMYDGDSRLKLGSTGVGVPWGSTLGLLLFLRVFVT